MPYPTAAARGRIPPLGGLSLTDGLVAYWHLNEASGNRADATGRGNTLVDGNTVLSTQTWASPFVADFEKDASEYLSIASNADVQGGDISFTLACELQFETYLAITGLITKDASQAPAGRREYGLYYSNTAARLVFFAMKPTDSIAYVNADTLGAPALATRYLVVMWHDADADTINIQVNNGAVDSAATGGALQAASTADFWLGGRADTAAHWYLDGLLRRVGKWNRVLSEGERTKLWNYGLGLPYPFNGALADHPPTSLLAVDGLGDNLSNCEPYRDEALVRYTTGGSTYEAYCYWTTDSKLTIAKRTYPGAWTYYHFDGTAGLVDIPITTADNHNTAVLGIDSDGYLHVAYDHHNSALNYRRSDAPLNSWTGGMSIPLVMLGTNEAAVTYPQFAHDPSGGLYFTFRDGGSGIADQHLYAYNAATTTWAAAGGTVAGLIISGTTSVPDQNPYMFGPPRFDADFGAGGFAHFAWSWREHSADLDEHDVSYVKWDGANWFQAGGGAQTMPITLANCEILDAVAEGGRLSAANAVDADADGHPHVVYQKNDGGGLIQAFHAWHNGASWVIAQITNNTTLVSLGDQVQPIWTYLEMAIDRRDDTVYVIHHGYNGQEQGLYVSESGTGYYTTWTERTITPAYLGYWFPQYNRARWDADHVFEFPICPMLQNSACGYPVFVLEWTP